MVMTYLLRGRYGDDLLIEGSSSWRILEDNVAAMIAITMATAAARTTRNMRPFSSCVRLPHHDVRNVTL